MFRTVPLSFIRSFPLYTQQWYVIQVCWQLQAVTITSMTYTIAVCTVKNSWWWTEELSETCRVLFQKLYMFRTVPLSIIRSLISIIPTIQTTLSFVYGETAPPPPRSTRASSFTRFLDHTKRRTTVGRLLWTSDQLVAETSTWRHTQHSQQTTHAPGGIPTRNPSKRAAADRRLRPRGHWGRHTQP